MANLPANPGQALWIGSASGKNHFNVGIGQGTSNGAGEHTDYSQAAIEAGSSPPVDPNKFFLNSDGNPVFRINASAGTTSTNTKHPRTECREVQPNGTSNAAWDGRSGDHYLRARCRIIQVTTNRPWVCFGQIHGSSTSPNTSDLIRLQTEGTNGTSTNLSLIARRTPPGGSEIRTVLRTGYNVGTWFDYEIRQTNGTITVKIDGVTVLTATGMGQIDNYFKFGCYLQDSIPEGAQSGDWGAVEFERGSVQVWNTGYPTPTTPVFTGGTDPGGGAGGGTGGVPDTQPPTVPANLTATPVPTGIQLDWDPSTDNVGVDHYNVYRSTGSTTSGGGTGDVDLSTAAGQLGWGTPLPSSDEFDYTGPPNPAKWSVYNSAGHDGNGVRAPARVTVGNGKMTLTGLAGSANTAGMAHKLGQQYGRWEVRARSFYTNDPTVPGTDTGGYHPVLIVWPTSDRWPDDGEYDFLENGEPGEQAAGAFMHYPSTNSADQIEVPGYTVDLREFHNFAFEWAPDGVTGWVDGVQWFTYADKTDGSPSGSAQNIQAMPEGQLTVQLDAFQATGCLASTMELEWARIYTLTPGAPGGGTDTGGGATSATFGRTAAGSATTTSSADKIIASKFTASAAGTLTEGHARAWLSATGSTLSRMLVYADSSGAPAAKLATSDEITITDTTSGSVQDYVFSGGAQIAITAGTSYWLALAWDDPGTPSLTYSRDSSSSTARLERSDITYGTFPNPWGTSTGTFTGPIDVWVGTGTAGSGGAVTSFGKQTNGASFSASTADKTAVSPFAATASGTLTGGHARAWLDAAGSTNTKVVVYADSSSAPGAKLAESDVVVLSATSEAVVDYTFSGANRISIANGTTYWLGLAWQDPGTPNLNLSRDATASGRQEASSYAPSPFGTPTAQSGPVDVYVDVTSSGSTGGSGGGQVAQALIATTSATNYLDTSVVLPGGVTQGLGVGGIPTPAAGPNVVLVGSDSSSRLTISTANRVVDGRGHKVAGITITADGVTVQNFVITGATHDAVNIFANNVTVQNCDIYGIADDGGGDINAVTLFGDGIKILYNTCGVTDFLVSGPPNGSHTDFVQTWNTSSKRSTSNLIVQGNRVVGPGTGDDRFIHQGVQGEGKGSTDGGGGGTGVSTGWLIADNSFEFDCVNQVINLLDIDNCSITRNTFAGSAAHIVGTGDGATGTTYYTDNVNTGTYGDIGVSTTAGPGPAGVVGAGGSGGGVAPRYDYAVTAVDAAGNESGQASTNGSGGSTDTVAPTVPTNVAASTADGRITLTWDPSTDDVGVARYAVRRGGTLRSYITAPTTRYVDIDLVNGVSYSYTVAALDAAGNASSQSSAVSATATGVPVTGATLLPGQLTGGKIQVQIAWGADLAADETTWTWSDVTTHVRQDPGVSTALGRNDESATSNPATLTVVLNNSSSDYSLGAISAHYPNVRRGTPVRVRIDPGDGIGGRIVFQGFADGFTPGWDTLKGTIPVVTLSASGTLRRLSQGSAPVQSVYRRVTTALSSVKAYWPMEEGKSSQFAYPVRGGTKFTYTGGQPSWGSDDSFDCSAALPTLANAYGQADVNAYTNTGTSQLRMLLSVPSGGLTDGTVLMHVEMTGTIHRWDLTYGITNGVESLGLYRYDAPKIPGTFNSSDIMAFKVNGIPGRLGLDWTQSGSNIIWTLSFTPATPTGANTATFVRKTLPNRTAGIVSHFEINPHNANIGATIGHITVENQITSFFADNDVLIAYAGETNTSGDGRLARLCTENGVALQRYTGAAADVIPIDQMGPQLVAPLLDLLHECERSNQGQLWDGRSAGLSYTTRKRREDGTVKLTVNAAAGQLAGEFAPVDDDQRNRNKVTVTRLHGATYTAEDATGALGTAAIGIYDDAVTVNVNDDDSIVDFANWFVMLGTVPGYRYPSVTVDLAASPTLAPAVLDIVPGERINVTNLDTTLAGFPDATVSLIVEGIAHEITTRSWRATFRCSPFTPWATGLTGVVSGVTPAVVALIDAGIIDSSTIGADTVSGGGTPGGGPTGTPATMVDATSVTFADSGGLSSNYHIYGSGLSGSGAGLVVHLHGDAAFEHLNPTSNYAIAGNRGLTAVCKAKGYVFVSVLAPDVTGTVTWWEAGGRNATYLAELLDHLITTYQLNRGKVWLSGYSGGSEFISYYFVPAYGKSKITGGGALIRGGGGGPAAVTPVGWDATFKAAFPMYWITGGQDDGTYADDGFDALAAATAGESYYSGQGFTTTRLAPPGIGHEIDGAFGPQLDDLLPTLSGYSPPSRTPGSVRPTLTTSYLVTGTGTGTTTTSSFTPAAGEVIVVKCWNADLDSPNIDAITGGGLTYATKIHIQATGKAEAWIFVAEVGASSPGSMTVSTTWFGTSGEHGMIVERWATGLVKGVPAQSSPVMGTGAPSATITPENANSVITWLCTDWNVTAGTATYRTSATQTQTSSTSNVRVYAAYQNTPSTAAQTVGLSAPSSQAWAMGAIELLPAH